MNDITQEIFGNQLYTVGKKSDTSKQVFTPTKVVNDMIDLLPAEIFNPDTTFIDIYCKSGIFLKRIYEKLDLALQKLEKFTNPEIRRNHILNNQIYGLVMDNSGSLLLCNKVIYGDAFHDGHLLYLDSVNVVSYDSYEDMIHKANPTKIKETIEKMFNRQGLGFDVVVGNPPYNRGGDIDFVNLGYELCNKYTVMITPAKWQTAEANQRIDSQMSYGDFRKKIVPHMKEVVYYPQTTDIFNIETREGVTYYLIDKELHPIKTVKNIVLGEGKAAKLLQCVQERQLDNRESLLNACNDLYNHIKNCDLYEPFKFNQENNNKQFMLVCSNQLQSAGGNMYTKDGSSTVFSEFSIFGYFNISYSKNHLYKVWQSDNVNELLGVEQYLTSKLVRFLILGNISTRNAIWTDDYFRFVPDFPYSDLQHVYNDDELYKLFGLQEKQIELVETVIRTKRPLIYVETLKRLKDRQILLEIYNQIQGCTDCEKLKTFADKFYQLKLQAELIELGSEFFVLCVDNSSLQNLDLSISLYTKDRYIETYILVQGLQGEEVLTLCKAHDTLIDKLANYSVANFNKWESLSNSEAQEICKTICRAIEVYMIQDIVIKQMYLNVTVEEFEKLLESLKLKQQIDSDKIIIQFRSDDTWQNIV